MSVTPKLINEVKISIGHFVEIDKPILNFKQKCKRPVIANKNKKQIFMWTKYEQHSLLKSKKPKF